jgi:anti-anti-sigma regulatory factor
MLEIRQEKYESKCILTLSGSLTVENMGLVREKLMELYSQEDEVVVNISDDSSIDFTFFQLMCSAHKTFASGGKCICFDRKDDNPLTLKQFMVGFQKQTGCHSDKDRSCLWMQKEDS